MKDKQLRKIQMVSCDLNGTLVHQHTMMDMIRVYFPHRPEQYERAKDIFAKQTSGLLSMKQAFDTAGPLTKGLTLRNAIEYARSEMRFIKGFEEFILTLYKNGKYFVINSTGYSVTAEVIKSLFGPEKIYGVICNRLIFAWEGNPSKTIGENDLSDLVRDYFVNRADKALYDKIHATGKVELGIRNEEDKAMFVFELADKMNIPRTGVAHIGDTMGDSGGICEVARNGGLGIAFNYNEALKNHLENVLKNEKIPGTIILAEPKGDRSDLRRVLNILFPDSL
ncbi:haloacid dehalogenase-like hydrolase [Desulfonema magnum]|uniref:Hydrolase domain-containing protein n=1 Tax=Desulfonema magnum TaxID=45655 RepID=A0A975C0M1_9BACT|nr:haloacid dehalogenase-like hydrolase [Desulfonema magnum]QTA93880.1 Hydrolase domain-containing protein [Desulfonema magnum]